MSQVLAGGRWIVKKKPVEVEAMLFNGTNHAEIVEWMLERPMSQPHHGIVEGSFFIQTLEGTMIASKGRLDHQRREGRVLPLQARHLCRDLRDGRFGR